MCLKSLEADEGCKGHQSTSPRMLNEDIIEGVKGPVRGRPVGKRAFSCWRRTRAGAKVAKGHSQECSMRI